MPFEVTSSGCNGLVVPFQQFLEDPMEVLLCEHINDLRHSLFHKLSHQCIDFLTLPTPPIIPHRLPTFLESLMPLKNWCSIHARFSKSSLKHSICFCSIFPYLKQNFISYRSSKVSSRLDYIFEIHQRWQSGFSRLYSNSSCSCSLESEIIKMGQSSHKMYSNNMKWLISDSITPWYTKTRSGNTWQWKGTP